MKTTLIAYAGSLATLLCLDAAWLGLIARTFYRDQLGNLMLPSPNLGIAALFYLFFAAAIVILAAQPALQTNSVKVAMAYGLVLGLAAYGTYDITNLATLKNWPVAMTIVDLVWGGVLTAMSAAGGFLAVRTLG